MKHGLDRDEERQIWGRVSTSDSTSDPASWVAARGSDLDWVHPRYRRPGDPGGWRPPHDPRFTGGRGDQAYFVVGCILRRVIEFEQAAYDTVVDHALSGTPEEVCGVLGGDYGEESSRVESVRRVTNVAARPRTTYEIAPEEQLSVMEAIEEAGRDVVGFYHSHPDGPFGPSRTDAREATWSARSYVIVTLAGRHPVVGSWRWDGDRETFVREVLRVDS